MSHVFDGYQPYKGDIERRSTGSLVSFETGEAVTYGLYNAQERGQLFITAGTPVYEGMIVGASPKVEDLVVNVCKKKHLTNTRPAVTMLSALFPRGYSALRTALNSLLTMSFSKLLPNRSGSESRSSITPRELRTEQTARHKSLPFPIQGYSATAKLPQDYSCGSLFALSAQKFDTKSVHFSISTQF